MEREIIEIDEDLCVGCGNCVPNCHQGALQIIDGKARLLSDLMCEGLGACVGHCPTGAMTIARREAEPYDEARVMEKIMAGGPNVVRAHLEHLARHRQHTYLAQAQEILRERNPAMITPAAVSVQEKEKEDRGMNGHGGCPGAMARSVGPGPGEGETSEYRPSPTSELRQWPVQLHLLNPGAPYFQRADVLLAADCTAFAAGGFHADFLRGKTLAIACPKLDRNLESYVEKLAMMVDEAKINTLTVLIMEVPCCGGLLQIARAALEQAERKIPLKLMVMSVEGEVVREEWASL
ncbi:MAG: 4Fe-4S dicluster domain-containing protein [Spirochaetaceae bacterium]|nr:MAG: 4Fe-4S dicluster domain-containing protein [Spirochaetaceae bacterium]